MKCYYREGEEWLKGYVSSEYGNRCVTLTNTNGIEFLLCNVEIRLCSEYLIITGYRKIPKEDKYELISVDVSGGWVKPR